VSIPAMFSPTVTDTPERAAPIARASQFARATSVEPKAPVKMGSLRGIPLTTVSMFTFGNIAASEVSGMPWASKSPAWMLSVTSLSRSF
jgi:hypothetical protein